jgi:hypothetical protein
MFDFEAALQRIPGETVLCVGDVMLDEYFYGDVTRISPEAPAPVLAVSHQDLIVGGAGNVARNIAGLGAGCILVSVVGEDDAACTLAGKLIQTFALKLASWWMPPVRRPERSGLCRNTIQRICCGQIGKSPSRSTGSSSASYWNRRSWRFQGARPSCFPITPRACSHGL